MPEKGAAVAKGPEWRHGVTPPMRDACPRHFRQHPDVDPGLVAKTEQDLLAILAVCSSLTSAFSVFEMLKRSLSDACGNLQQAPT